MSVKEKSKNKNSIAIAPRQRPSVHKVLSQASTKNAEAAVKSVVAATPKIGPSAMGAMLPAAAFAVVVDCST